MESQQKGWNGGLQIPTDHDADAEDVVVYADMSSVKERRPQVILMQKGSCGIQ